MSEFWYGKSKVQDGYETCARDSSVAAANQFALAAMCSLVSKEVCHVPEAKAMSGEAHVSRRVRGAEA